MLTASAVKRLNAGAAVRALQPAICGAELELRQFRVRADGFDRAYQQWSIDSIAWFRCLFDHGFGHFVWFSFIFDFSSLQPSSAITVDPISPLTSLMRNQSMKLLARAKKI